MFLTGTNVKIEKKIKGKYFIGGSLKSDQDNYQNAVKYRHFDNMHVLIATDASQLLNRTSPGPLPKGEEQHTALAFRRV